MQPGLCTQNHAVEVGSPQREDSALKTLLGRVSATGPLGQPITKSNIAALHRIHQVVARAHTKSHDGQRGILTGVRRKP
jgi:hypothetical protein